LGTLGLFHNVRVAIADQITHGLQYSPGINVI
jgi:hypothetical protein